MQRKNILCINDDVSELKIFEIINMYFGKNYTSWMKAGYEINEEYSAWFPIIYDSYKKPDGKYGGKQNWCNNLIDDGKRIIATDFDSIVDPEGSEEFSPNNTLVKRNTQKILVFGRIDGKFRFLGVFDSKNVDGMKYKTNVHDRIAVGINLDTFELITDVSKANKTEWFISCNPNKFDLINAFRDLKRINWRQSTNIKVGDIVYIYSSGSVHRINIKCVVNKVNLEKEEIDDSKYILSEDFGSAYGRYMELELLDEFNTDLFDRFELEKHGFGTPQSPVRIPAMVKDYLDVVQYLLNCDEMDPDKHDGSYELARETVKSYKNMNDLTSVDYRDLNLLYHMVIGTWRLSVDQKKKSVDKSNLPESEKTRLKSVIDKVRENAFNNNYENHEDEEASIGMFGTGFYSFNSQDGGEAARIFIGLCIEILDKTNDEEILDIVDKYLAKELLGLKAASATMMLHCINPYVFPILNTNFGSNTIYEYFGIKLDKMKNLTTLASNCRKIKEFRDSHFTVKNYRIYDNAARLLNKDIDVKSDLDYMPSLEQYNPGVSKDVYIGLLKDEEVIPKTWLDVLLYMYEMGGQATCTQIAELYGNSPQHYNANAKNIAEKVQKVTNCHVYQDEAYGGNWCILFFGKYISEKDEEKGLFKWKLRDELYDAIKELSDEGYFDMIREQNKIKKNDYPLNTILYGPPGTGKTYNTILYAVSICDNRSLDELKNKAYSEVLKRFKELRDEERIVFTTFHQSYGYEEFIEGIKPVVNDEEIENKDIGYAVEDGLFKRFCSKAVLSDKSNSNTTDFSLNKNPSVWKVSLEGTGDNPTRKECLENDHIRIGWDSYGEIVTDDTIFSNGGKVVLNSFINKMQIGDVVLSCYSASSIDAIGIVTGEYEWHSEYTTHKRLRKVKWLAKNINYNIVELNDGANMTLATVYKLKISIQDVFKILNDLHYLDSDMNFISDKKYVFIIDEINRGNISKIFGELITLIESTKRIGNSEEMKIELPYSRKEFGVPNNVYILGTMNTADRSIALMDTALRRRFKFIEMMPDYEVLKGIVVESDGVTVDIAAMLKILNQRIEYLYDREHTLGHAYFIGLKDDPTIDRLADIFEKNVIPLLKEYFYEDYSKIQLVLGDDNKSQDEYKFIKDTKIDLRNIFNSNVSDIDIPEKAYQIQKDALKKIQSYKEISKEL